MKFLLPPTTKTSTGQLRRVGFEIEFGGVPLESTAEIIQKLFGGSLHKKNVFSYELKDTKFGSFAIESDARFLSQTKYDSYLKRIGISKNSEFSEGVESLLQKLSGTLLPFEIAMPPLPITYLDPAEQIRYELFKSSATGTRALPFSAFGMQINPELPDFEVDTILSYLRAFLLLFDWLTEESDIVIARRIAPFIHAFPQDYIDLVLDSHYKPTLDGIIDDYLQYNPTRNRPLDLLPLIAHLQKEKLLLHPVERDLIKARPTFHYRLPNSEIDDPDWSFAHEWNKWVEVEKLAFNRDKLFKMMSDYQSYFSRRILFAHNQWANKSRDWLHALP